MRWWAGTGSVFWIARGGALVEPRLVAVAEADEDFGEAAEWASRLSAELAELDETLIDEIAEPAPDGAKGPAAAAGALLARLTGPGCA